MRRLFSIVGVAVAAAAAILAPVAEAGETDCDNISLEIDLEGYLPTWCYFELATQAEARAQWEAIVVEGAHSYGMAISGHAFAFTYLPRQSMETMIEELLDDAPEIDWQTGIPHDDFTIQRFAIVQSSGRQTNCIAFNKIVAAPNGRPRSQLYGYLCMAGSGVLEEQSALAFVNAIDD